MNTSSELSSIGEAVSGRGDEEENVSEDREEEDIFYIPERRPSLDLGSSPMETGNWCFVDHAVSPVQSYWSMDSEGNSTKEETDDETPTGINLKRTDSFSSCYSFDSDNCETKTLKVKIKDEEMETSDEPGVLEEPEEPLHPSYTLRFVFTAICDALTELKKSELEIFKMILWEQYPDSFKTTPRSMDIVDIVDRLLECYSLSMSLKIIKEVLDQIRKDVRVSLEKACLRNEVVFSMREQLKQKYCFLDKEFLMADKQRSFNEFYTNLSLTSTTNSGPNIEHEILTIPTLNSYAKPIKEITTKSILERKDEQEIHSKFILISGLVGSGKSMIFRRLIYDWIEDEVPKTLLIPLTITELKVFEDTKASFEDMISKFYPEMAKLSFSDLNDAKDFRTMFVFDGLDGLKDTLNFRRTMIHGDMKKPASLNKILTNLFEGRMFSNALCVALGRPMVKSWLAWDMHCEIKELQGFHPPEREEYFKKRFEDPHQANRVIEYVKSSKTLHIMCHLPLFCSLLAKECEQVFREKGLQAKLPSSMTYYYTKLLLEIIQTRKSGLPFCEEGKESEFVLILGKLAYTMLEQGCYGMKKHDWGDTEVTPQDVVICGLMTQFTIIIKILTTESTRSFLHPTMQEYMAALYAYITFRNTKKNIFEQQLRDKVKDFFKGTHVTELYKSAVEKTLQHENGKLDMFLCFLFGMANKKNQELLQQFCSPTASNSDYSEAASQILNKRMKEYPLRKSTFERCKAELEK